MWPRNFETLTSRYVIWREIKDEIFEFEIENMLYCYILKLCYPELYAVKYIFLSFFVFFFPLSVYKRN
jgi:hypothetical protein